MILSNKCLGILVNREFYNSPLYVAVATKFNILPLDYSGGGTKALADILVTRQVFSIGDISMGDLLMRPQPRTECGIEYRPLRKLVYGTMASNPNGEQIIMVLGPDVKESFAREVALRYETVTILHDELTELANKWDARGFPRCNPMWFCPQVVGIKRGGSIWDAM